jgi:hypothetical protein
MPKAEVIVYGWEALKLLWKFEGNWKRHEIKPIFWPVLAQKKVKNKTWENQLILENSGADPQPQQFTLIAIVFLGFSRLYVISI